VSVAGFRGAAHDVAEGARRGWLWGALGRNDIRQRYSGSVLGSLWITVNIVLLVLFLTMIFARPFGVTRVAYVPYAAVGLVLWYFIQATLLEAPHIFVTAADAVRHSTLPLSVQVFRLCCRNAIVLAHNAVIVPVVLLWFRVPVGAGLFAALAGLLLLFVALTAAGLLLAVVGARFRDVSQFVSNGLQLLFFATPIFWLPSALGPERMWIATVNPAFALIDVVRAPLTGAAPAPTSWAIAAAFTAAIVAAAALVFSRHHERISYWV